MYYESLWVNGKTFVVPIKVELYVINNLQGNVTSGI
jgi:hypothetical protein